MEGLETEFKTTTNVAAQSLANRPVITKKYYLETFIWKNWYSFLDHYLERSKRQLLLNAEAANFLMVHQIKIYILTNLIFQIFISSNLLSFFTNKDLSEKVTKREKLHMTETRPNLYDSVEVCFSLFLFLVFFLFLFLLQPYL